MGADGREGRYDVGGVWLWREVSLSAHVQSVYEGQMGILRACLAVAVLALAACGSDHANPDAAIPDAAPDAKVWSDAPPGPTYDFSCAGNAAPTTATPQITVSGTVRKVGLGGSMAVQGATLKACKNGAADCTGANQLGADATSAANGGWSIGPFDTSSMPVDAYIAMTATGARPTHVYSPSPLVADLATVPVQAFDPQLLEFLASACPQDDNTNGIVVLLVTDCAAKAIGDAANVTLSIKQGGTEVTGTSLVNLGQLDASAAGTFMVCNVPANVATEVNATYKTTTFRAHTLGVVAGTTTNTIVRPGY